jgi:hypothetical protein
MQRHLAALETLNTHAGARGLALAAAAGGLAFAGADAATDALSRLAGAGAPGEFVKFHNTSSFPLVMAGLVPAISLKRAVPTLSGCPAQGRA